MNITETTVRTMRTSARNKPSYRTILKNIGLALMVLGLSACSSIDRRMRPEPAVKYTFDFGKKQNQSKQDQLQSQVPDKFQQCLLCMDEKGKTYENPSQLSPASSTVGSESMAPECIYLVMDSACLIDGSQEPQKDLPEKIAQVVNVSEQNCSTFLNRMYVGQASSHFLRDSLSSGMTAFGTGIANSSPATATGLGLVNLLSSNLVTSFDQNFLFNGTMNAIGSAIRAERAVILDEIAMRTPKTEKKKEKADGSENTGQAITIPLGNAQSEAPSSASKTIGSGASDTKPLPPYQSIHEVLRDIRRLDDACSMRVGVSHLQALAEKDAKAKEDPIKAESEVLSKTIFDAMVAAKEGNGITGTPTIPTGDIANPSALVEEIKVLVKRLEAQKSPKAQRSTTPASGAAKPAAKPQEVKKPVDPRVKALETRLQNLEQGIAKATPAKSEGKQMQYSEMLLQLMNAEAERVAAAKRRAENQLPATR